MRRDCGVEGAPESFIPRIRREPKFPPLPAFRITDVARGELDGSYFD